MPDFRAAGDVVRAAIAARVFPGASVEVGTAYAPVWRETFGRLAYDADAQPVGPSTIYDLASLTKVVATTTIAMRAVERGVVALDDLVSAHVPGWQGADRAGVTVRDLLSHASGLPAHLELYRDMAGAQAFTSAICAAPLAYSPRTGSLYSDLDFILLGIILAGAGSLVVPFDAFWSRIGAGEELQFLPPLQWRPRTAPTEVDPWRGRLVWGEVHDENCYALGGVAGHAGLFGSASAVGTFARHVLQVLDGRRGAFTRATLDRFIERRVDIPGSSRALGWDTMLPTSSCGTRMSTRAFGHTGFTGTSLWIDPVPGTYVVLLSNRVHPSREGDGIQQVRRAFHDAVMPQMG